MLLDGSFDYSESKSNTVDHKNEALNGAKTKTEENEDMELPSWLKPENIMDKAKHKPDHPDYDPSSLYVPQSELVNMTPARKQFWQLKANNFDKILFFKVGKFYEMYYDDAIICHDLLGLNWTGPLHVGFPEKTIEKYTSILIQNGFKVAVAEHLETPSEMKERVK